MYCLLCTSEYEIEMAQALIRQDPSHAVVIIDRMAAYLGFVRFVCLLVCLFVQRHVCNVFGLSAAVSL